MPASVGWTFTTNLSPFQTLGEHRGPPVSVPANQASWGPEFATNVGRDFARRAQAAGSKLSNVQVTANNGAGDTNGVGSFTIIITGS